MPTPTPDPVAPCLKTGEDYFWKFFIQLPPDVTEAIGALGEALEQRDKDKAGAAFADLEEAQDAWTERLALKGDVDEKLRLELLGVVIDTCSGAVASLQAAGSTQ